MWLQFAIFVYIMMNKPHDLGGLFARILFKKTHSYREEKQEILYPMPRRVGSSVHERVGRIIPLNYMVHVWRLF